MLNRNGPLKGLRIIEMAGIGPAPFACMVLADLGADILRIARPNTKPIFGIPQKYSLYDRNRRTLELDLRSDGSIDKVKTLIAKSEALIEGFRPGVMERLGLGPDVALETNPALVYGRMTGWGQTGPLRDRAGHDLNYMAITGALWSIGPPDTPPPPPLNIVADLAGGGMLMVTGILAALMHARATNEGQAVDVAMSDGAALMMAGQYGWMGAGLWDDTKRGGNVLNGGAACYRCYETSDGGYVALGAIEPQFFAKFLEILELSDNTIFANQYAADAQGPMQEALRNLFLTRDRDDWAALLEQVDACFAPVLSMTEAPSHPHNIARATFVTTDGVLQPGPCPRFFGTPADPPTHGDAGTISFEKVLAAWAI